MNIGWSSFFSNSWYRDEEDDEERAEPREIPMQRVPIPFGAMPQQYPLTHMPQQQMPAQHMMPPQMQQQVQQLPPQIPFMVKTNSYFSFFSILFGIFKFN